MDALEKKEKNELITKIHLKKLEALSTENKLKIYFICHRISELKQLQEDSERRKTQNSRTEFLCVILFLIIVAIFLRFHSILRS